MLEFTAAHTRVNEEVFFYPCRPMYYFLSGSTNPTRFSILVYNYNTRDEFQEAVQNLESRQVKYVVWDTNFENKIFASVYPAARKLPPDQQVMEPYLNSKYAMVAEHDGFRIMMRKDQLQP